MAKKIVAQEECMFCREQPCVCAKSKSKRRVASSASSTTTGGGAPPPVTNSEPDEDG